MHIKGHPAIKGARATTIMAPPITKVYGTMALIVPAPALRTTEHFASTRRRALATATN